MRRQRLEPRTRGLRGGSADISQCRAALLGAASCCLITASAVRSCRAVPPGVIRYRNCRAHIDHTLRTGQQRRPTLPVTFVRGVRVDGNGTTPVQPNGLAEMVAVVGRHVGLIGRRAPSRRGLLAWALRGEYGERGSAFWAVQRIGLGSGGASTSAEPFLRVGTCGLLVRVGWVRRLSMTWSSSRVA
jgi:hypothetical protein